MSKKITPIQRAYLAGFLDGDGSIYVRLKPNKTYKYDFQIAPYIVLFQSKKAEKLFQKICALVDYGYLRERKDGVLEYTINKQKDIIDFLKLIKPYLILKQEHAQLMIDILLTKQAVSNRKDFVQLARMIDRFRDLNYSKKRIRHNLTP